MANTVENPLQRLKEGNERFQQDKLEHQLQDATRRGELVDGQSPFAIVLSCADSRVAPELAFDTGLGEIFVIRVAGNIANTSSIASIEYAVHALKTKLIVVLGHESCGAVGAAVANDDLGHNLNHLLVHIKPAVDAIEGSDVNTIVRKNAELTAQRLVDASPIIKAAVNAEKEEDRVKIVPAFYNFASGKVDFFEDEVIA